MMQDRCKFDASLMQAEETFTFTLDEETEKKLFELLTDVDVSKTSSFSIKDKYGNEAEYVKVVRCRDCKHWIANTQFCSVFSSLNIAHRMPPDGYCSEAERKEE